MAGPVEEGELGVEMKMDEFRSGHGGDGSLDGLSPRQSMVGDNKGAPIQ
jgi:hypothetical protein